MEEDEEGVDLNRCNNCLFYVNELYDLNEVTYETSYGECRRFPPRRIDGATSGFPIVDENSFCGEHQKKFDESVN